MPSPGGEGRWPGMDASRFEQIFSRVRVMEAGSASEPGRRRVGRSGWWAAGALRPLDLDHGSARVWQPRRTDHSVGNASVGGHPSSKRSTRRPSGSQADQESEDGEMVVHGRRAVGRSNGVDLFCCWQRDQLWKHM